MNTHTASDFVAKNIDAEVACATALIPNSPADESTYGKARLATLSAVMAAEAFAKGDSDQGLQAIETTIRHYASLVRDFNLDLLEVLPTEQCAECGTITTECRSVRWDHAAGSPPDTKRLFCSRCIDSRLQHSFPVSAGEVPDALDPDPEVAQADRRPNAHLVLEQAQRIVSDRRPSYGPPSRSFTRLAKLWSCILDDREIEPHEVALLLAALKISRLVESPEHEESWVDGSAYFALGAEVAGAALKEAA